MERLTRRQMLLLAIPVLLICGLVVLFASGLLVVGVGPLRVNTSGPTVTAGPVSIATDHSRYLATDRIRVTVTNHSASTISAEDGYAYCTILSLQVLRGGAWMRTGAAGCGCDWSCGIHCMMPPIHRAVAIAPGASYTATIRNNEDAPFPAGAYRLTLRYATASTASNAVTTAPFDVLAVLISPPACPISTAALALRQRTV